MLIQIIFSLGLAHANPVPFFSLGLAHANPDPFFSLGLAHANPDPFFHWAWHMLIQILFSLGLSHVPNKVHACGVCSHTGRLILRGDRIPKVCLRCMGLLLPPAIFIVWTR